MSVSKVIFKVNNRSTTDFQRLKDPRAAPKGKRRISRGNLVAPSKSSETERRCTKVIMKMPTLLNKKSAFTKSGSAFKK